LFLIPSLYTLVDRWKKKKRPHDDADEETEPVEAAHA
jgi:hypothetical protein